jgi:hypothetical protein
MLDIGQGFIFVDVYINWCKCDFSYALVLASCRFSKLSLKTSCALQVSRRIYQKNNL